MILTTQVFNKKKEADCGKRTGKSEGSLYGKAAQRIAE
jgi:hypothetical protein